jgi:tartrate dehydrogenase/decarboxylase/D-malate dehydrogenase
MAAIERVTATGPLTPDMGGTATTEQVASAVCDALNVPVRI